MAPGKIEISSGQFPRLSPSSSSASSNKSRGKSAPVARTPLQLSLSVVGSPAPRSAAPAARRLQGNRSNPQQTPLHEPPWTPPKVLRDTWIHKYTRSDSPNYVQQSPASPSQHLAKILLQPELPLQSLMRSRPFSSSVLHSSTRIAERNRIQSSKIRRTATTQVKIKKKASITSSSAGDVSSDSISEQISPLSSQFTLGKNKISVNTHKNCRYAISKLERRSLETPVHEIVSINEFECKRLLKTKVNNEVLNSDSTSGHKTLDSLKCEQFRPLAPSPPSSTESSGQSSLLFKSSSTNENILQHIEPPNKYSFPVPPLSLSNYLNSKLRDNVKEENISQNTIERGIKFEANASDRESSNRSVRCLDSKTTEVKISRVQDTLASRSGILQNSETHSFTEVSLTLMDIQEQVLQLVDSQQACSRSTWMLMQRLSASLDQLTTNDLSPTPKLISPPPAANLPPPVLLMEAAGCARRLADILSLIGATPSPKVPPPPPEQPTVTKSCTPSPAELQEQRTRLRHVTTLPRGVQSHGGLAEALSSAIVLRRCSVAPDETSGWGSDDDI